MGRGLCGVVRRNARTARRASPDRSGRRQDGSPGRAGVNRDGGHGAGMMKTIEQVLELWRKENLASSGTITRALNLIANEKLTLTMIRELPLVHYPNFGKKSIAMLKDAARHVIAAPDP